MLIIGDIHANYKEYLHLLKRYEQQASVQIGDFGFGFEPVPELPADAFGSFEVITTTQSWRGNIRSISATTGLEKLVVLNSSSYLARGLSTGR